LPANIQALFDKIETDFKTGKLLFYFCRYLQYYVQLENSCLFFFFSRRSGEVPHSGSCPLFEYSGHQAVAGSSLRSDSGPIYFVQHCIFYAELRCLTGASLRCQELPRFGELRKLANAKLLQVFQPLRIETIRVRIRVCFGFYV
jgi:hypothetical protein